MTHLKVVLLLIHKRRIEMAVIEAFVGDHSETKWLPVKETRVTPKFTGELSSNSHFATIYIAQRKPLLFLELRKSDGLLMSTERVVVVQTFFTRSTGWGI